MAVNAGVGFGGAGVGFQPKTDLMAVQRLSGWAVRNWIGRREGF